MKGEIKTVWLVVLAIVLAAIAGVLLLISSFGARHQAATSSFDECAAAGNPIMESYPRQCRDKDGKTFREDIGNELEKDDLIRIESPRPNASVSSPLIVRGVARGTWYFEASFPVKITDENGNVLGQVPAQAKSDWMTENFVPFEATLSFTTSSTENGYLILEKDNPSGLPEHDDALKIPIVFAK